MTTSLRVILRIEAQEELDEAIAWYDKRQKGLGGEFLSAVDAAIDVLRAAPKAWPLWRSDRPYRRYVMPRFPFILFFTEEEGALHVIAIAHTSRNPGYWVGR